MSDGLTPMMRQYQGIRRSLPEDVLLMFRLGDFYEMFFEDAKIASPILNVALTKRGLVPMCGVPFHAAEGYIAKLIKAGKRVAVCDQTSEPSPGKIVDREVTQIISAGTISDLNLLESGRNNYLAAVFQNGRQYGFAFLDLTTGDFRLTEFGDTGALLDEIARVSPSEIVVSDQQKESFGELAGAVSHDGYAFHAEQAEHFLLDHFRVKSLDGFGCSDLSAGISAAGALLHYLKHQMRRALGHVNRLGVYQTNGFLFIDSVTRENLELVQARGGKTASLLHALDRTMTPMGARTLRDWLLNPLQDRARLEARQETVSAFLEEPFLLAQVRETLRSVRDVERTLGRLSQGSGNARDLSALLESIRILPDLQSHLLALLFKSQLGSAPSLPGEPVRLLAEIGEAIRAFPNLEQLLQSALQETLPATIKEGGIFRDGHDSRLDELRAASREGKNWIAALQQQEIERTGIKSLKIRFNSVFGYFIEITKSNLDSVPADYTRKQTTVNGERFITPELKTVEGKILGADERSRALEYELFQQLRETVLKDLIPLQKTAAAIGRIDTLQGLAETARLYSYRRPKLTDGKRIEIRDGRHPVLDQRLVEEKFVPNDLLLDETDHRLLLITGPNMAGKSTFIRQAALLVLMAQIGSYVPAAAAEIGMVDRIFTRVGASDDLGRGQSTFMVEMNETANILNNATDRSLVILDEIGRGTSTFDGLSIAWSVAEHLHDVIKARSLFATHFHEMTEMALTREGVKNLNVAVREWNEEIIFLRKIIPGAADKSYGIQVARLAGLPKGVIERAQEVLGNLEKAELNAEGKPRLAVRKALKSKPGEDVSQLRFL